jgi:hypothetical protein
MNEAQLIKTIKAHIERGDKAKDKADQHYELKAKHTGNWDEWTVLLREKCDLSTGRASELARQK